MKQKNNTDTEVKKRRKKIFNHIVDAFGDQYSWLGAQTSRELLLSVASRNLAQNTDPPYRMRMHIVLAWKRWWLKSTMLNKMASILGDDYCSLMGKVTSASIRGSISAGKFSPPKVSKKPIVVSTELGQTQLEEEALNTFLALLEEGRTNISLNKIGGISESQKDSIQDKFPGIQFGENEFNLETNFVFWAGTYDPDTLDDSALKQRLKIVTPAKSLENHGDDIIDALINQSFRVDDEVVQALREEINSDKITETNFVPPRSIRNKYTLEPRELGDLQRYMACRNWWGLDVNPEIMDKYIAHLKKSRKIADMSKEERVMDLIFDNPMTYDEIINETGMPKMEIYQLLEKIGATRHPVDGETHWVMRSGDGTVESSDGLSSFLEE